jgi:hypothetical protein
MLSDFEDLEAVNAGRVSVTSSQEIYVTHGAPFVFPNKVRYDKMNRELKVPEWVSCRDRSSASFPAFF